MTNRSDSVDQKKQRVRTRLRTLKQTRTYQDLAAETGVNTKELNYLIRFDSYDPPAWVWAKLGVPVLEPAPVCVKCGVVHTTKRCTAHLQKRKTLRRAINLEDPESAAATIIPRVTTEYRKRLVNLLDY
jgi:hypothetical protein